jgi:DNA-binding PadR family transcriptional regulator
MSGYQLRAQFEDATAATWPLNIGQAYTTLSRLERDGFVEPEPERDADGDGRVTYRLTAAGREERGRGLRRLFSAARATRRRSSSRWR